MLLDGVTQRIEEELGQLRHLGGDRGLARYVTPLCRHPLVYDPELLMKGLAMLLPDEPAVPAALAGQQRQKEEDRMNKLGILGSGRIVREFLPWLAQTPAFALDTLCTTPAARRQGRACVPSTAYPAIPPTTWRCSSGWTPYIS